MKENATPSARRLASRLIHLIRLILALCVAAGAAPAIAQEPAPAPKGVKARVGTDRWGVRATAHAFGPEDALAVAHKSGYVRLWDASTQHLRWEARPSSAPIDAVAFAGTQAVVAAASDGSATVFNAATGEVKAALKLNLCNKACELRALYASDKVILTLGVISEGDTNQGTLKLWSLSDGKLLQTHIVSQIVHAALSPDGAHVAWSTYDTPAPTHLASAASLASAKPLPCGVSINAWEHAHVTLAFSPDSKALALLGPRPADDSLVSCAWSTAKATPLHTVTLPPHPEEGGINLLRGALFSTDSKWLLLTYQQGDYGRDDFYAHHTPTTALEVTSGKEVNTYDLPAGVHWTAHPGAAPLREAIRFEPVIAQRAWGSVQLTGLPASRALPPDWLVVNAHTRPVNHLAASPTGAELVSVDETGRTLRWRLDEPAAPLASFKTRGQLLYAPDGARLLEASPAQLVEANSECDATPQPGSLGAWALNTMTRATLRRSPKLMTKALRWLPDGKLLSCREEHDAAEVQCGYPMGPVRSVFEVVSADGASVTPLKATFSFCPTASGISPATMRAVTHFNPEAESEYGADQRGTARVQDLATGEVLFALPGEDLRDVALSPDGKWVALYTHDIDSDTSTLRAFSVDAKAEALAIPLTSPQDDRYSMFTPTFSPEGWVIFADGKTLRAVDPSLGADAAAKATSLAGHTATVSAATFSADGKTLFTAQADGLIFAWDWPPAE